MKEQIQAYYMKERRKPPVFISLWQRFSLEITPQRLEQISN